MSASRAGGGWGRDQIKDFCDVKLCILTTIHQSFVGICCLLLQNKVWGRRTFENLVHKYQSTRHHTPDPSWSCSQAVSKTCMTYTIAVCTVKNSWWWTEELSETCIEFYSKNIFEKLVHLVGFIIRIYHDARLPERQIKQVTFVCKYLVFTERGKCYCIFACKKRVSFLAQIFTKTIFQSSVVDFSCNGNLIYAF